MINLRRRDVKLLHHVSIAATTEKLHRIIFQGVSFRVKLEIRARGMAKPHGKVFKTNDGNLSNGALTAMVLHREVHRDICDGFGFYNDHNSGEINPPKADRIDVMRIGVRHSGVGDVEMLPMFHGYLPIERAAMTSCSEMKWLSVSSWRRKKTNASRTMKGPFWMAFSRSKGEEKTPSLLPMEEGNKETLSGPQPRSAAWRM
jgi:hypothetical protein